MKYKEVFFIDEKEIKINERKFLFEKFEKKIHIPIYIIFALGILYLYFFEGMVAYFIFDIRISIYDIILSIGWTSLWIFTIFAMLFIRKTAYNTIDQLNENSYFNKSIANEFKNKLLNFKINNKIEWKKIIYVVLLMMFFTGMIVSIIGRLASSNIHWFINTGGGYQYIEHLTVFIIYQIIHWSINLLLTVLILDVVVLTFSLGRLTSLMLEHIKGNIDFYNSDGHGGLKSLGMLMSYTIIIYFLSLSIFSILLGLYFNPIYLTFIITAWLIGIGLIWRWKNMVQTVIRENKDKYIIKYSKRIKKIENEKNGSLEINLYKDSELSYLSNKIHVIKEIDDNPIGWEAKLSLIFPIISYFFTIFINIII